MMGSEEFLDLCKGIAFAVFMVLATFVLIMLCIAFFAGQVVGAEPIVFDEPVSSFVLPPAEPLGVVPECFDCGPPSLDIPQLRPCDRPGDPTVPSIPGNPGRPGCGGGTSVPEPNNGWLLLIAVLCLLFVAQRQRKI
jgi:hypothetical protein